MLIGGASLTMGLIGIHGTSEIDDRIDAILNIADQVEDRKTELMQYVNDNYDVLEVQHRGWGVNYKISSHETEIDITTKLKQIEDEDFITLSASTHTEAEFDIDYSNLNLKDNIEVYSLIVKELKALEESWEESESVNISTTINPDNAKIFVNVLSEDSETCFRDCANWEFQLESIRYTLITDLAVMDIVDKVIQSIKYEVDKVKYFSDWVEYDGVWISYETSTMPSLGNSVIDSSNKNQYKYKWYWEHQEKSDP